MGASPSDALILLLDRLEKYSHVRRRLQVVNPFRSRHISDKLPISGRQPTMTEPNHAVAVQSAAPHWAILWPALRSFEKTLDEALCDPPVMRKEREVNVNKRISCRKPVPSRGDTAKAVNDPLVSAEEVCVYLQVLVMWNLATARSVLDCV